MQLNNQLAPCPLFTYDSVEAQTRLAEWLYRTFRLPHGRTKRLYKIVIGLRRGFDGFTDAEPAGRQWATCLLALERSFVLESVGSLENKYDSVHPLALLLEKQPTSTFSRAIQADCLNLAARAFLRLLVGVDQPKDFWLSLGKIFSSHQPAWEHFRGHGLLSLNDCKPTFESATYGQFDRVRLSLGSIPIPSIDLILKSRGGEKFKTWQELIELKDMAEDETANDQIEKRRKPTKFDPTERRDLFAFQTMQQEVEPALNGYRLDVDWNTLAPAELRVAVRPLVDSIRSTHNNGGDISIRLHAASRLLTLFTDLSLQTSAGLPLTRVGTMHLDLKLGILRRDSALVSPRADRPHSARWWGRWWRTPIPSEIIQVLREAMAQCPTAKTLGDLLLASGLTPTRCHRLLNDGWLSSHRPEDLRFARSLRPCLLGLGIHPSITARITGDITITPVSQHYYLSLSQKHVYQAIDNVCDFLGLKKPVHPQKYRIIGSPKIISIDEFKLVNQLLTQDVLRGRNDVTARSRLEDYIEFHNQYVQNVALQLLWGIGARFQRFKTLTVGHLLSHPSLVAITDRENDTYSSLRLCCLSRVQQATRLHLVEHLLAMSDILEKRGFKKQARHFERIATGRNSRKVLFPIIHLSNKTSMKLRGLRRNDLNQLAKIYGVSTINSPRHFLVSELVDRSVAAIAIDAQIGHHIVGAEPFGFGSGMSVSDFQKHLAPALDKLHEDIGMKPLAGLGRSNPARLKLPSISINQRLNALNNSFLEQRIAIQDFTPPDRIRGTADAPFSPDTLLAQSHMQQLRKSYQATSLVSENPIGSLAFCLAVFDGVATLQDLIALTVGALGGGISSAKTVVGIEVYENNRPVLHRLVSRGTASAAAKARQHPTDDSIDAIFQALHKLLQCIDPTWPGANAQESTILLLRMTSHCLAVEVSPINQIALFHKAPFIPMKDITRILLGKIVSPDPIQSMPSPMSSPTTSDFECLINIVRRRSDKDKKIGELKARRQALADDLGVYKMAGIDEAESLFCDWLIAECSDDRIPFKRLRLSVLLAYALLAKKFFSMVRALGTINLDAEDWQHVSLIMGGRSDLHVSTRRRWVVLHLTGWLADLGVAVPPGLVKGRPSIPPAHPHLSVYLRDGEADRVTTLLSAIYELPSGNLSAAAICFKIARKMPFRPAELRYLRWLDIDVSDKLMHVTTSGHDHLKTVVSRGCLSISGDDEFLKCHVALAKQNRTVASDLVFSGTGTDEEFQQFDKNTAEIRATLWAVTGCQRTRVYDLRANAITDLIYAPEAGLKRIAGLTFMDTVEADAKWLSARHSRAANSAREARQSSVLTTLRYYHLSALIEAREQIDAVTVSLPMRAAYLGGVAIKSAAAIYCSRYRRSQRSKVEPTTPGVARIRELSAASGLALATLPAFSDLASPSTVDPSTSQKASSADMAALIHASLLALSKLPVGSCAQACNVTVTRIDLVLESLSTLRSPFKSSTTESSPVVTPAIQVSGHPMALLAARLSLWARDRAPTIFRVLAADQFAVRRSQSFVYVHDFARLQEWVLLVKTLRTEGVIVHFQFIRSAPLELRNSVIAACEKHGIFVVRGAIKGQGLGALRFSLAKPKVESKKQKSKGIVVDALSPHTYGRVGRAIVSTLLLTRAIVNTTRKET